MTIKGLQIFVLSWFLMAQTSWAISVPKENALNAKAISKAAGTEATIKDDGVVRIGWLRTDVPVIIDGIVFPPEAGLGSWAGFQILPSGAVMVMGDTVVFEDEITPAMDAAFAHGLEVTALHNHFVFDRPPVYFMHISGQNKKAEILSESIKAVWDAIKSVRAKQPKPVENFLDKPLKLNDQFDVTALKNILGVEPELYNNVLKFTFERKASMHKASFGASMGLSTWVAFSGNKDKAVVDGDFAMTADEVQSVMHALREAGIHIVALHNHMIGESPVYYFLHFWGKGNPKTLAKGIRSAIDKQK